MGSRRGMQPRPVMDRSIRKYWAVGEDSAGRIGLRLSLITGSKSGITTTLLQALRRHGEPPPTPPGTSTLGLVSCSSNHRRPHLFRTCIAVQSHPLWTPGVVEFGGHRGRLKSNAMGLVSVHAAGGGRLGGSGRLRTSGWSACAYTGEQVAAMGKRCHPVGV